MSTQTLAPVPITLRLDNETATDRFAEDLAMALRSPMSIHLKGDLGAGKTALARSLVRHLVGDKHYEVPSPTFSLVQTYEGKSSGRTVEILHADLYRISEAEEVEELGILDEASDRILLIEWPEKADGFLPEADLTIGIEMGKTSLERELEVTGSAFAIERLQRSLRIRSFLNQWTDDVDRRFLLGDASSRSYESVSSDSQSRILMNAPRQPDGPIIRDGKPYSQIAHLAEDVSAFAGVQAILTQAGLRVPVIYQQSLDDGLLLIENLGSEGIIGEDRKPIANRYHAAVEMLAEFHQMKVSGETQLQDGNLYQVPQYDREAMLIEAQLLVDWYAPRLKGDRLHPDELSEFNAIWNELIDQLDPAYDHLVLRDFHSPNIIWQEGATGANRIGLIDFQDAVIGPAAYDVASIAQDARVDVNERLENDLVTTYCAARVKTDSRHFDVETFRTHYAIMAALRSTKILGIFVRLDERDGKPAYLAHLPRMQSYIDRSLQHPVLSKYRDWYKAVIG